MKDVDINLLPTFLATKLGPIHLISKKFAGKLIIAQKIEESIGNLNDRVNKKSELMLMRRARAYSSSCSQEILVYIHFVAIHSFAAKNRQKITKNQYF